MNIPVVYYHSVAKQKNPNWVRSFLTLELRFFEDQLKFFKKNNYTTIFLDEYFNLVEKKSSKSEKYVCITLDDGFLDNWIYIFPVLKKYNMKATIFINPETVDLKANIRKNLEDYWNNSASLEDIDNWGYLSWDEMRSMEKSGLIDIQSHTLTHTKYFTSDKIIDFHHPGSDCLYPVGNLFPQKKPCHITDPEFEKLVPYGYPFFEEESAIIAKKVEINSDFINEITELLNDYNWTNYTFESAKKIIDPTYKKYKSNNKIIANIESELEYKKRVEDELRISKETIEQQLRKKVFYCCWPHGDYNQYAHDAALKLGYKGTTVVLRLNDKRPPDRFDRFGMYHVKNNRFLSRLKTRYKIESFQGNFPYIQARNLYYSFKFRKNLLNYGAKT